MSIESKGVITISDLFHAAAELIQSSEPGGTSSNEVKLRLYGLYKRCTIGRAEDNSSEPMRWNTIAHRKYMAWKECDSLVKEDAMRKYVETVAGLEGHVGDQCRSLLETYHERNNNVTEKIQSQEDIDIVLNEMIGTKKKNFFETFTGIQPFVPRGQLDISYSDLCHALVECLKPTAPFFEASIHKELRLEKDISKCWGALPSSKVHVGLSVRSLFDLYLSAKSYPKGSEVIVVPPIGIEGMIDVLHYHGLKIIPVDIDDYDDQRGPIISVNLDRVKGKLSESTVAILVVHPFGLVCTNDDDMKSLRLLCNSRSDACPIEIWEDCAECYSGGHVYHGSPYANVQFFSFGTIKTSTALGGGVCVLNQIENSDVSSFSDEMRRIQFTIYEQQTRREYLTKILKALILHLFSKNYILLGVGIWIFQCFRINYDTVITASLKGFPSNPYIKDERICGSVAMRRASCLIRRLRKRPHPAMMSLLFRRIHKSESTKEIVKRRILRCMKMKEMLHRYDPSTVIPGGNENSHHLFWLFPFLTREPETISKRLHRLGFDIPRGTSQLACVTSFIEDPQSHHSCPNTERMMSQILYLPIASIPLKDSEIANLVAILRSARSDISKLEHHEKPRIHGVWRPVHTLSIILIFGGRFIGITLFSTLLGVGVCVAKMILFIVSIILVLLYIMRISLGQYYLRSTAYAKYNCIFNDPKSSENVDKQSPNHNQILENYDPIKLVGCVQDSSAREEQNKVILVGATGFIGSLILRDLLLHRKRLGLSGGVVVICRQKRGLLARERINNLLSKDMFSFLPENQKQDLVSVLEGDLSLPRLGMSDVDYNDVCNLQNVSLVINSAACVNFTEPLERAAVANITTALQLQDLTLKLRCSKYVYISTAFVHGDKTGTEKNPLSENLFDLGKYRPEDLYKSMMETQSHASAAMTALGFPNTYTFTKCICEHLLLKQKMLHTIIIRPSIVGPAVQEPFEGWAGDKPSTLVAGACLYLKSPFNIWNFRREKAPVIPVDILSRFILSKAFHLEQDNLSDDSDASYCKDLGILEMSNNYERRESIYNAAWDTASFDTTCFHWYDFACAIVQLGTANRHVSSVMAYAIVLISFKILLAVDLSLESFKKIHKYFVHGPLIIISSCCEAFNIQPLLQKSIRELQSFIDLPVLFFPFTTVTYNFRSELKAPDNFNGERYMFSCVVAAENFINSMRPETEGDSSKRMYDKAVIAGSKSKPPRFDLLWALMQPAGNLAIRFIGYIVIKILRAVSTKVQVDLPSLSEVQRTIDILKSKEENENDRIHIILAPTHRSVLDFVLISFVAFSLPETGLQIPIIAASDEFANIPVVGILARWAGAFFLSRGRGRVDPSLRKNLLSLTGSMNDNNLFYFEVFLEGKRSRDRRFLSPKTGFLRCLNDIGGTHVLVPITISYERIPEQRILAEEACGRSRKSFCLSDLMVWLKDAFLGNISLGKIDISFATPVVMNKHSESNIKSVTSQVQLLQRDNIMISNYHIRAAASILGLDSIQIRRSLQYLQCKLWYDDKDTSLNYLEQPSSSSESWTVFLQFAHLYAPYLQKSHPEWAKWLNSNVACGSGALSTESPDVMKVVGVLKTIFDDADTCVKETTALLMNKGFSQPSHAHILQYVKVKYRLSSDLILRAAIVLNHREEKTSSIDELSNKIGIEPLFQNVTYRRDIIGNEENFGAWGYRDSGFVVSVEKSGARTVQMKGNRYMISGRKMPKLIPFLEHETSISFDPHIIALSPNPTVSLSCTELSELSLLALYKSVSGDKNRVTTMDQDRVRHGTGHSQQDMFIIRNNSVSARRMPDAVVYPKSENEVENIVNLAAQMNWCLIPFGGGTNVSHATWCPPKESDPRPMISMDMRLMDSILLLNEEDCTVHVQAGITGGNLIRELRARGFTMGHEPDSLEFSTVGGWIATKASGMKQNRYGNIEDIVQNVHVISANGKLWQNGECDTACFARVSTGTDLTSLMLGSEGSLGIITSAVLKVWPLPEVKEYESVILHSFDDGLRFVKDISKLGALKPASVRLLDNTQFRLGQSMASNDSLLDRFKRKFVDVIWTLIGNKFDTLSMVCVTIAFEGSLSEVKLQRGKVKSIATYHGGFCAGSKIGRAGYDMTFAIAYVRDFAMTHGFLAESFETFVPWSKVNSLINATKDRLRKEHIKRALPGQPIVTCRITQLYDQGVCVYFYFCMNFDNVQNPSSIFADIELAARQEILAQGGSLSHHHGIGKHRAQYMNQVNSASFKSVLMNFKTAVDPNNVFGVLNGSYANE